MDFRWTEAQAELFRRITAFARANSDNERAWLRDRDHEFPRAVWKRCGEFGLLGLSVPGQYGGMGLDVLTTAGAVEAWALGCEDMGLLFSASAHLFACVMPIVLAADEPLRARVLPHLASGEWVGANAITEAEAGSDVFALRTRAERDGDHYVLNGSKSFVSNGPVADVFLVYATTNPSHGYLGVSAFLVERGAPGLVVGEPFGKLGLRTAPVCSVYLEGCRVPAAHRVGNEGNGGRIFEASMQWERACLFASYLGAMERQLGSTIEHARGRAQRKQPIARHQAVSHRIVDMKLRLEAARLLSYRACWLCDRGDDATLEVSLAKLAVSEAAVQSGLDAIQIHGGNGVMDELGVERALRDAIPSRIFSGTSEVQRNLVAHRLGLLTTEGQTHGRI